MAGDGRAMASLVHCLTCRHNWPSHEDSLVRQHDRRKRSRARSSVSRGLASPRPRSTRARGSAAPWASSLDRVNEAPAGPRAVVTIPSYNAARAPRTACAGFRSRHATSRRRRPHRSCRAPCTAFRSSGCSHASCCTRTACGSGATFQEPRPQVLERDRLSAAMPPMLTVSLAGRTASGRCGPTDRSPLRAQVSGAAPRASPLAWSGAEHGFPSHAPAPCDP